MLEKKKVGAYWTLALLKPHWLSTSAPLIHMRQARLIGQIYVMLVGEPIKSELCCHVPSGVILKQPVRVKP